MRFTTLAIREGQDPDTDFGAVINPIYQSATFAWKSLDRQPTHDYTRVTNPNRSSLEAVLAGLEHGKHAVCFSSGMASVVAAFSILKAGEHLLVASDIYGGTFRVAQKLLPRQGIEVSVFDANRPESIEEVVRPNTRMVIFETPTNPTLKIADIQAIAEVAKRNGLISVIDNTFASPYLQTPLDLGIDIVLHSTTKYISGHSDVIGGAIVTNSDEFHALMLEYIKTVGSVPSPFDCWLTLRGLKTLALRMRQHCENARAVAEFLVSHPNVTRVYFPGLADHPGHEIAAKQMKDFGGMVSFEVAGDGSEARAVAENCRVFQLAESLGGVESIIGYPAVMSHGCLTEDERLEMGIRPTLLRLSVGIEDVEDILEDLDRALTIAFSRPSAAAAVLA